MGPPRVAHHPSQPKVDPIERLISAAVLTSTAFRMRDSDSLTAALRIQAMAVNEFQRAAGD